MLLLVVVDAGGGKLDAASARRCLGGCLCCCLWWWAQAGARPSPGRKYTENTTANKNRASTRRGQRIEENKEDEAWPFVVGWKKDRNKRNQKARAVWMQRMKGV